MASGISRGRVFTTTTTTESRKMVAIVQLIGKRRNTALVYSVLFCYWTSNWHLSNQSFRWPVSCDHIKGSSLLLFEVTCFFKWAADQVLVFIGSRARVWWARCNQGRVARKRLDANPRLKINRIIDFSRIQMFFTAFVLCVLRLFKTQNRRPNNIQKSSSSIYLNRAFNNKAQ